MGELSEKVKRLEYESINLGLIREECGRLFGTNGIPTIVQYLQELADRRKADERTFHSSVYRAEPFAGVTDGIASEVTAALEAAAESFYDLRALLESLHLLTAEATDRTAEIRIRDILNKYAVMLDRKPVPSRPFEIPSDKV